MTAPQEDGRDELRRLADQCRDAVASDGIAAAEKVWPLGPKAVYDAWQILALLAAARGEPGLDVERLRVATWRLSNAAASLARHARSADDPAHRSWFPSAIGDVLREVDLARRAAGTEPDFRRAPVTSSLPASAYDLLDTEAGAALEANLREIDRTILR